MFVKSIQCYQYVIVYFSLKVVTPCTKNENITAFSNFTWPQRFSVIGLEMHTLFKRILLHAYYVINFKSKYLNRFKFLKSKNRFHHEIRVLHGSALVTLWKEDFFSQLC